MTAQVRFDSQERVDLPDMQAVSLFSADEIRKTIRHFLTGDATARILRGFQVLPENDGVSPRVVVSLNTTPVGAFTGALAQGGSVFDFGQLGGGHDAVGALEGPAQLLVDFTGQPVAAYQVKIRAAVVDGRSDNRAFWNASSNAEFVRTTPTRSLLQWEIAISGHSDADWILIATVNWGGAAVASADITDERAFALEGAPGTGTAAQRWSHADQPSAGSTGVGDFDRGADRAALAVSVSDLWSAWRALARQVQDLKGGRDSDLRYDWFSRVFAPAGGGLPAEQTKSLRTIEAITFSVADGATDQADFNGSTALYDCFAYIAANSAALPKRIRIVVKNRVANSSSGPIFAWSAPVTITGHDVQLRCFGSGFRTPLSGSSAIPSGAAIVSLSAITAGQVALTVNAGSLDIEDVVVTNAATSIGIFALDTASYFRARRCLWGNTGLTGNIDASVTGFAVRCSHQNLLIDECTIGGVLWLGGRPVPSGTTMTARGLVRRSLVTGYINARHDEWSGSNSNDKWLFAMGLVIEDSTIADPTNAGTPRQGGVIDLTGASDIEIRNCTLLNSGNQDFVCMSHAQLNAGVYQASSRIRIGDNQFSCLRQSSHAAYASPGLLEGTGWCVKAIAVRNFGAVSSTAQVPTEIVVEGNVFDGGGVTSAPDAGAVALFDARGCRVARNSVINWAEPNAGSGAQYLIAALSTTSGLLHSSGQNIWIASNFVGRFARAQVTPRQWGGSGGLLCCIAVTGVASGKVTDNIISAGHEASFGGKIDPVPDLFPAALQVQNCANLDVERNQFLLWRSGIPTNSTCTGIGGTINQVKFTANQWSACGGFNFVAIDPGTLQVRGLSLRGNEFYVGHTGSQFSGAFSVALASFVNDLHLQNNHWDYDNSGGAKPCFQVGPAVQFSLCGNYFYGGIVQHDTLGGSPSATSFGYGLLSGQSAPNDSFNFVAGYV